MTAELMLNLRRAGFSVPLNILPLKAVIYFHVEGTASIAEPIFNGAMETRYLPAGRRQLSDTTLHLQNPTLHRGSQFRKYLLHESKGSSKRPDSGFSGVKSWPWEKRMKAFFEGSIMKSKETPSLEPIKEKFRSFIKEGDGENNSDFVSGNVEKLAHPSAAKCLDKFIGRRTLVATEDDIGLFYSNHAAESDLSTLYKPIVVVGALRGKGQRIEYADVVSIHRVTSRYSRGRNIGFEAAGAVRLNTALRIGAGEL
ncbi:hypothetical protein BO71DRAFT_479700 [Aspergillus ellipticus CBS 707.79]|uniref:Uncharacterized protein n=1 Tax=Aspergillus ellipticus CBS 707.79 TaxID=1448320 RepID=A0A319F308_9EURO|nr:hypothetical protein BO71DRAFT_479700 [Aspergillus ellipticus CBS 707.79]